MQSVGVAGLGLLAGCGRWPGQTAATPRVHWVGWLGPAPLPLALRQELREIGYVETANLGYVSRFGSVAQFPQFAAELASLGLDVIVTGGEAATRAVLDATSAAAVVFTTAGDPVSSGLVQSFNRPGGRATGFSEMLIETSGKRLELLREIVPHISRLAVLWVEGVPDAEAVRRATEDAARVLGLDTHPAPVQGPRDLQRAFVQLTRQGANALFVAPATVLSANGALITQLAARNGLPAAYPNRSFVEQGGLISFAASNPTPYRRTAAYVDRILKGTKPADLPVEQPREFEFMINLKTAQALGLTIPQHVLLQATEVIQ